MYRTNNCGELRLSNNNQKVILSGWVNSIRIMKKYYFVDIRDFYGVTQLIIKKKKIINKINNEYVIRIKGKVIERKKKNKKLLTGDIEVKVKNIKILNKSKKLPFKIEDNIKINNRLLLKYRYLYLRTNKIKNNLIFKSNIINLIRLFFIKKKFLEIETPYLVKNTSEGARDFIVPYRRERGLFYTLPQSPQIFKQLLMIGGYDKYYQIVKCFRDEDLRDDRQPEFLQLDVEMSFVNRKDLTNIIEKLIKFLLYKYNKIKLINIKKITYKKVIKLYNTDKPDLRYKIFKFFINEKKIIKNNKNLKNYNIILPFFFKIININIKKFIYILVKKKFVNYNNIFIFNYYNNLENKKIFCKKKYIKKIIYKNFISKYDLFLLLLLKNYKKYKKIKKYINNFLLNSKYYNNIYIPIWVYDYPLFKFSINKKKILSYHHPFTKPKYKIKHNINLNNINLNNILANSYDLIINGIEIGSGSIRINNKNLQLKIFKLLGLSNNKIKNNYSYFLKALEYGTPPHCGIGIGIDRLILLLLNKKNIKNFIAFPKNYASKDLMLNAPSKIEKKILLKLGIKIKKK